MLWITEPIKHLYQSNPPLTIAFGFAVLAAVLFTASRLIQIPDEDDDPDENWDESKYQGEEM